MTLTIDLPQHLVSPLVIFVRLTPQIKFPNKFSEIPILLDF
jgi:hypothetical protein